jgi:hypothetical protein
MCGVKPSGFPLAALLKLSGQNSKRKARHLRWSGCLRFLVAQCILSAFPISALTFHLYFSFPRAKLF